MHRGKQGQREREEQRGQRLGNGRASLICADPAFFLRETHTRKSRKKSQKAVLIFPKPAPFLAAEFGFEGALSAHFPL